jgi:hypothetical protein
MIYYISIFSFSFALCITRQKKFPLIPSAGSPYLKSIIIRIYFTSIYPAEIPFDTAATKIIRDGARIILSTTKR